MERNEVIKLIAAGAAGIYIGNIIGAVRENRRRQKKLAHKHAYANDDVLVEIKKWFDDASDTRLLGTVVDEWFYENRFKNIVKGM